MQQLAHIFHLIEQKYNYSLEKDPTRATHVPYMTGLQYGLDGLDDKIVANASAHLEDELGNILRDFCNLIYTLQKEWYIDSTHNVWERALDKYEERVWGIKEWKDRNHSKWIQKERLFQEQVLKNS